jgi:hypothetical protein
MFPNNKIVFKLVVDNLDNVVKTIEWQEGQLVTGVWQKSGFSA